MKSYQNLALVLLLALFSGVKALAGSGSVVSSEGAWCWFADPRAIHYENADKSINASYLGYIDVHGNVRATQYDFNTGVRSEVLVRSYFQPDDHNNPTFLVLPDERVLIIYSRHTDERAFYYRVSVRPGDISELGAEKKITTADNTTYPSPFILSDDPEHFYLCWRGIGWHPTIAKFTLPDANDEVRCAYGPYQIVKSTGARPYAKYSSNGKDKIFVTYTTGHPDNEQPNWVYYNVVNIASGTPKLEDIKGNALSTIANGPFNVSKQASYKSSYPYTVVEAPSDKRDWVWQTVQDTDGNPVIAMVRINGGKDSHDYCYGKWTGDSWRVTPLVNGGGRFHSSNTEYCYSGGMAIDPQNPKVIYLSVPTEGDNGKVYEIWKYTIDDNGEIVDKEAITSNSLKNNVRPYVLPGSAGSPLRLAWMNGDYYYWMVKKDFPAGFPTDIRCDYNLIENIAEAADTPSWTADYGMKSASETQAITMPAQGSFALLLNLAFADKPYGGAVLKADGFEYGLDASTTYPYVIIGGKRYNSSNKFYTSDAWASNSSGTSGDNWATKLGSFNLSLSYDGSVLTVYRNGLIDQKVAAPNLKLEGLTVGGFEGTLNTAAVYNSHLSQADIKYVMNKKALEALSVPAVITTDVVLPAKVNGQNVTWTSSHPEIVSPAGIFNEPATETEIVLTASYQGSTRNYKVVAMPRDITKNLLADYSFEAADVYNDEQGVRKVKDNSGAAADMAVYGSATVDGTLNLSTNAANNFNANGYAILPSSLLKDLRSYTVMFTANAKSLTGAPRFYDLGCNSGNSVFFRASALAAGIKYNGGTTTMLSPDFKLAAGTEYKLAVTFDADGHVTTVYVNGEAVGNGNMNVAEPYMLAFNGECTRAYIGRTQWWDTTNAKDNQDYVGTIDNLSVYNTALSRDEIRQLQGFHVEDASLNIDCSDRIANRGFEGSFAKKEGTGVDADRAIYEPESWTVVYANGNNNDLTIVDATCLYANLFGSVKAASGDKAYRIRQKWGTSTIGLSQTIAALPAGYYRIDADAYQTGGGGTASIVAETPSFGKASAGVSAAEWAKTGTMFFANGLENLTISCTSVHDANGTEQIVGFDNFILTDVTANRSAAELATLLRKMESAVLVVSAMGPDEKAAVVEALAVSQSLTEESGRDALYAAYVKLRNAIANIKVSTGVTAPSVSQDTKVYDLNGRQVERDGIKGIYIVNGRKTLVK